MRFLHDLWGQTVDNVFTHSPTKSKSDQACESRSKLWERRRKKKEEKKSQERNMLGETSNLTNKKQTRTLLNN